MSKVTLEEYTSGQHKHEPFQWSEYIGRAGMFKATVCEACEGVVLKERNEMFDTELFVTYNGRTMRWFAHGGRSGSDPVGLLSDEDAVKWAEAKLVSLDCGHLNFTIEEED